MDICILHQECILKWPQNVTMHGKCAFIWHARYHAGGWFNIKKSSYQYNKSHYGDKTILRPSYPHNEIYRTDKNTFLYWIWGLVVGIPYQKPRNKNRGFPTARLGSYLIVFQIMICICLRIMYWYFFKLLNLWFCVFKYFFFLLNSAKHVNKDYILYDTSNYRNP